MPRNKEAHCMRQMTADIIKGWTYRTPFFSGDLQLKVIEDGYSSVHKFFLCITILKTRRKKNSGGHGFPWRPSQSHRKSISLFQHVLSVCSTRVVRDWCRCFPHLRVFCVFACIVLSCVELSQQLHLGQWDKFAYLSCEMAL